MIKSIVGDYRIDFGNSIIKRLQLIYDLSFMAGGACRDTVIGLNPADYDFYYYSSQSLESNAKKQLETIVGIKVDRINDEEIKKGTYECSKDIKRVYTSTIDGKDCQFIQLTEPKYHLNVVDNFPLNLCQASLFAGKLHTSLDFDIGVRHGVLYKTAKQYSSEGYYIRKIRNKLKSFSYFESKEEFAIDYLHKDLVVEEW